MLTRKSRYLCGCAGRSRERPLYAMFLGLMHHLGHREARSQALMPGRYLTDGCRLLRVVSRLAAGREQVLVALEDCATLKVQAYAQSELGDLGLRAVRTADTAGAKSAEFSRYRPGRRSCFGDRADRA